MTIRVIHGREPKRPRYRNPKVRLPRQKPVTAYPKVPKRVTRGKARHGLMANYDDKHYMTRVDYLDGVQVGTSEVLRYRRIFAAINARVGNFIDPTPHTYESTKIWYPLGERSVASGGHVVKAVGGFGEDYGYVFDEAEAASQASVYNEVVRKLYDQLRDSDLNLSTDIAEWKQLDRMLEGAFRTAAPRLYRWARKAKNHAKPGMTLDEGRMAIGNAWLAYTYGWRPLLSSIWGLLNFERSICSKRKLKARAKRVVVWSRSVPGVGTTPPYHYTVRHSRRCEIGMTYRVSSPNLFDVTRITSVNPIAIAWELMPYSFVVDWFVDVGGYMRDMEQSFFLGLDFSSGYTTYTDKVIVFGRYSGSWGAGTAINAPFRTVKTRLHREPLLGPPKPRLPRFEPHLGWRRLTSAAALLQQILSPVPDRISRGRFINGVLYPK